MKNSLKLPQIHKDEFSVSVGKYGSVWATHTRPEASSDYPTLAVFVHGFPGDSKSYADIFEHLANQMTMDGLHTLRFDMRGCGNSERGSKFFTLKTAHEDIMAVLKWALKLGYAKLIFVTEGLGAIVAMTALNDQVRPHVAGAIMLWPILDGQNSWLAGLVAQGEAAEKSGEDHIAVGGGQIGLGFIRELRDYKLTGLMGRLSMPLQIHHGTEDTMSPIESVKALLSTRPGGSVDFMTYEGADHGLKTAEHRRIILSQVRVFLNNIT